MSNGIHELSKLSFDGKEWITELRNKLCANGDLAESDVSTAFDKLHSEKKLNDQIVAVPLAGRTKLNQTLHRIYDNNNVGGLYDNNEIEFSPQLTVVYGKNGSGKSSFYRLLKDAFHSRQGILGNIYSANTSPISAKVDFIVKNSHLSWQKKGKAINSLTDLNTVSWTAGTQFNFPVKFCDSGILADSLSKKNAGWSLDRYKLGYYDKLRLAVEGVESKVSIKISELNLGFGQLIDAFVKSLKTTGENAIKDVALTNRNIPNELLKILKGLNKIVLSADHQQLKDGHGQKANAVFSNYTQEIDLYRTRLDQCKLLALYIDEKIQILSGITTQEDTIKSVRDLKKNLDFAKFDPYKLLFSPQTDPDKYIELIKKIAESALVFGFKNYPKSADKCFYCNQTLSLESKKLIKEIHEMVDSEINKEIGAHENTLNKFVASVESFKSKIVSPYKIVEVSELCNIKSKTVIQLDKVVDACINNDELETLKKELNERNESLTSTSKYLNACQILKEVLKTEAEILADKINFVSAQLTTLEKDRSTAKHNLNLLEDNEYCLQQKVAIESMIEKLEEVFKLQKAQSQFSSQKMKLSKDKGRVEDELIRQNYLLSFNKHLADFGFKKRERISRPFSTPGGSSKVDSRIESNSGSFEINSILSEGEAKVYSLCDWLTELEFDENETLVFDDPITSLDQVNIDKVVDKIVSLSNQYQTIVFTHNLEFYHRLVQKSLGGGHLHKAKCEICSSENEKNQCGGFMPATGNTHKCCSYYQIEYILQPGKVVKDVMFLSLNWEQRIELLRKNLLAGNIQEADKHLRTSINNFFERFVLADIKRSVYKNNDLIKEYRDFREIDMEDYDALMEVHNKVSAEGTLHEPSAEVRTPLDVQGYITEFNKAAKAINKIHNHKNSNKHRNIIEPIEIV